MANDSDILGDYSSSEPEDLTYQEGASDDEEEVDHENWDERATYVKTITNDRSWVSQRSFNDGKPVPPDKMPADPNFVATTDNAEALYATALKLANRYEAHELAGLDFTEEPCLMHNLSPGMLIKVKHGEEIPADIIPIALGNPSGVPGIVVINTREYDDVHTFSTMEQVLLQDVITDVQQLKNYRFYARVQTSTFALAQFQGAVTYAEEDETALIEARRNVFLSEKKENMDGKKTTLVGAQLSATKGLDGELERAELDMDVTKSLVRPLCYRMKLVFSDPASVLYGLCVYTGEDTKWNKWRVEEEKKHPSFAGRAGGPRRPKFQKAKKVNIAPDKKSTTHNTKKYEMPVFKGNAIRNPDSLLGESEQDPVPQKIAAIKNDKKRMLIILGIILLVLIVCGAVIGIVFGVVGFGGDSTIASVPSTIGTLTASPGTTKATINLVFLEPSDNGAPISSYTWTATDPVGTVKTSTAAPLCGSGLCRVECTGLDWGLIYSFKVHASNSVGKSSSSPPTSALSQDLQSKALQALYEQTGGNQWGSSKHGPCPYHKDAAKRSRLSGVTSMSTKSNSNWFAGVNPNNTDTFNINGDYCSYPIKSWTGISCTDGLIDKLNLQETGLKGTIPTEIGYLTGLKFLSFLSNPRTEEDDEGLVSDDDTENRGVGTGKSHCQYVENALGTEQLMGLSGTLPTELGKLTALTEFDMSNTLVSGSIPGEFAKLSNLEIFMAKRYDSLFCYMPVGATGCEDNNSLTYAVEPFYSMLKNIFDRGGSDKCNTDQDDDHNPKGAGLGLPCVN